MMSVLERLKFGFRQKVPVILQTEAAECGLACMTMVANFYGHDIDLAAMRRRYSMTLKGMNVRTLIRVAGQLDLTTRALRLTLSDLVQLRQPCILHWDLNHFVVLVKATANSVVIHDPGIGRRSLSYEEVSTHFTGIALEVWPNVAFQPMKERHRIKLMELFKGIHGLGGVLRNIILLSVALEIFSLLSPIGMQIIIDQVVVSADLSLLTVVVIGMALLTILQMVTGIARKWILLVTTTKLSIQLQSSLFDRLLRLPIDYFEKRHVGDITSRFSSIGTIQQTVTGTFVSVLLDGVMTFGFLIMMIVYGGWWTALAILTTFIYTLIRIGYYNVYRQASEGAIVFAAKQNTHFIETVRGMSTLKLFDLRERRKAGWLNHLVDTINAGLRTQKLDIFFSICTDILFGADRLAMLYLGGSAIIAGHTSLGMFTAFMSYKDSFSGRIGSLIGTAMQLKMLSLHADRVSDIVLNKIEEEGQLKALPATGFKGRLSVSHLTFRYGDGEPEIFKNLNLTFEVGESVAIVGPSGCGKTTLLKILAGLIPPTSGELAIDGTSLHTFGLSNYRKLIGCVLQRDTLFSGSIADNISAFDPSIDTEMIFASAKMAALHDDIMKLPMGYETLVGDMGSTLSGGQVQRVFLARAIYKRPLFLFLDEATSHLDEANEMIVNSEIQKLNITRIIAAHRPSTINSADRIIDMRQITSLVERAQLGRDQ